MNNLTMFRYEIDGSKATSSFNSILLHCSLKMGVRLYLPTSRGEPLCFSPFRSPPSGQQLTHLRGRSIRSQSGWEL